MKSRLIHWAASAVVAISALGFASSAQSVAITVDYGSDLPGYAPGGQQSFDLASLSLGGITVTGSNTVHFLEFNGIGVVGGTFPSWIDSGETVDFSFDSGPVTEVSFFDSLGNAGDNKVQVFGAGGANLGVFNVVDIGTTNVSSLVGGAPITGFQFRSDTGIGRIRTVTYNTQSVPEPTTTALLALGLLGAGFARKRRAHLKDTRDAEGISTVAVRVLF
jgi:hypothetical protein